MTSSFSGVEQGVDPLALLDINIVEKSPGIQALKAKLGILLPSRFGNFRTYISPMRNLQSVIRADCQNDGCGVRAFIHIQRSKGKWDFVENVPK